MRRVRPQRRSFVDLYRITIGDYIIAAAALLTLISLFLPWFTSSLTGAHSQWAFTYSEVVAVIVIVFFLATLVLIVYPALSADLNMRALPFATPLLFLMMGAILLLLFTYELGKYGCIQCAGVSRGIGVWIAWIAAWAFLFGAIIKWGSRPDARL